MSSNPSVIPVLAPPPVRTAVLLPNGLVSSQWTMWFQKLADRVGGPISLTVQQLNAAVLALQAAVTAISAEIVTIQATQTTQEGQITALQASQASLSAALAVIQSLIADGVSVTITTAKLTTGGANGSMTFTNGILTAQTAAT